MVFKDVVWAGVEAAVGKYLCSDIVVVDGGKGGKGDLVGKGRTQDGAGGHVGVRKPGGNGVVDIADRCWRAAGEGTSEGRGGYTFAASEGTRALDRHGLAAFCRRFGLCE
jgi:hypothetical protein